MDLRQYYAAVQLIENQIEGPDVLVVSEATSDGGKAGVFSEVTRQAGARLVVEQKARLATTDEQTQFRRTRVPATAASLPDATSPAVIETTTKHSAVPRARRG